MTREDVLKLFPDATAEQITQLLNRTNAEVVREKEKGEKYKAEAQKTADLQAQLDEINTKNMTDAEKSAKALEEANKRIAELEKAQAVAKLKSDVIDKFKVSTEQANLIIKEDGSMDMDALGQIIADKETAAAQAKEQEIARNATNPGGGSVSEPAKPADVANAEKLNFGEKAAKQKDYYVIGG